MTALSADRPAKKRSGRDLSLPVAASTKLYAGGMVCLNSAGWAVPGSTSTTLKAVGVAIEAADNSTGANGDVRVPVERGVWGFNNSASTDQIALTEVGSSCYIVDDQTVAKTNGGSTRSVAGTVRDVDSNGTVWVEF